MIQPGASQSETSASRLEMIERQVRDETVNAVYARLYAPLALTAVIAIAIPLFDDQQLREGVTRNITSMLEQAASGRGEIAGLAMLLVALLVALTITASARLPHPVVPACIAVFSAVLIAMLISKTGYSAPKPNLSYAGIAVLIAGGATAMLAFAHTIHVVLRRRA